MGGAFVMLMSMLAKGWDLLLLDLDDGSETLVCKGLMMLDCCERRKTLCGLPPRGSLVATTGWGQHPWIKYFLQ
jgi:hypothetical protein